MYCISHAPDLGFSFESFLTGPRCAWACVPYFIMSVVPIIIPYEWYECSHPACMGLSQPTSLLSICAYQMVVISNQSCVHSMMNDINVLPIVSVNGCSCLKMNRNLNAVVDHCFACLKRDRLIVLSPESNPVLELLSLRDVPIRNHASFTCTVNVSLTIVKWKKDRAIIDTTDPHYKFKSDLSELDIDVVDTDDSGSYQCIAQGSDKTVYESNSKSLRVLGELYSHAKLKHLLDFCFLRRMAEYSTN